MNRTMIFWMTCLALTAAATVLVRGSVAAEPAFAAPGVAPAPDAAAVKTAPAPEVPATARDTGAFSRVRVADLVAVVVYSLLGLLLGLFGYKVYDWLTPFDLRKELEIDQNTSVGIVCGAIILGMCIIVAAAIRG